MSSTLLQLLVVWLAGIPALVLLLAEIRPRYLCWRRTRRAYAMRELLRTPPPLLVPRSCQGGRPRSPALRRQKARARK